MFRCIGRYLRLVLPCLLLGACDTFLGGSEEPPLPGERIPILLLESDIEPDPRIADVDVILPPPVANEHWPQAGGFPDHAMHHLELADAPERAWSVDIGTPSDDESRILTSPIVVRGKVYAMDAEAQVTAYDAIDGDEIWEAELTNNEDDDGLIGGGLAYGGGRIIVSTGFAEVFALDPETGEEQWRRPVSGPVRAAPTVSGGRVFVVTIDNKLHALDAGDGSILWTHNGIAETAGLLGGASPAVEGEIVIVPYSSGEIFALRVENGRVLWSDTLTSVRAFDAVSALADIRGHPVIDRGKVYAVSHAGRMVAIDLRTGGRSWERSIGGTDMPWVAGEFIFVLTSDSELLAMSRRGGQIRWVTRLPKFEDEEDKTGPISWTGPVLASDRLVVANSASEAYAVSPYTGELLGRLDLPDDVYVSPVVALGSIYFLTEGADLAAYR